VKNVSHMSEDDLERYAMRTLNEADLDRADDHLLVCPECWEQLGETERYVLAKRAVALDSGRAGRLSPQLCFRYCLGPYRKHRGQGIS
jgi:hypothetical protein